MNRLSRSILFTWTSSDYEDEDFIYGMLTTGQQQEMDYKRVRYGIVRVLA